jgi:hypothetical protein
MDLLAGHYPECDLMICRDLLFHLSYSDINKIIKAFLDSNIKYILTTTHLNDARFVNVDIQTGRFRYIDLFSNPFNFPCNYMFKIDDWKEPDPPRLLCLWSREALQKAFDERYRPGNSLFD